jgi:hypothetical protein
VVGVMGLISFVSGILAYQGRYKSWLVLKSFLFPGWPGLAGLYLGLGLLMIALAAPLLAVNAPGWVMAVWLVITAPAMVTGIIAMFWLPRFLWPRWLKDTEDEIRRGEDALSQALKPGGSLYGRLGRPRSEWPTEPDPPAAAARPGLSVSSHDSRSTGGGTAIDPQDEWRRLQ